MRVHAPGLEVKIENNGIAQSAANIGSDVLDGIIKPFNVTTAVAGTALYGLTIPFRPVGRALAKSDMNPIRPLADALMGGDSGGGGFTEEEIATAELQTGTGTILTADEFIRQSLDTNIPGAAMAGPIVAGFGMNANDPRLKWIQMLVGASAGFTNIDPINLAANVSKGLKFARTMPLPEYLTNNPVLLAKYMEGKKLKDSVARMVAMRNAHSIEEVTSGPLFRAMSEDLAAGIRAAPDGDHIGEAITRLHALGFDDEELAWDMARAARAKDPARAMQAEWQAHYYGNFARSGMTPAVAAAVLKASTQRLARLSELVTADRIVPEGLMPQPLNLGRDLQGAKIGGSVPEYVRFEDLPEDVLADEALFGYHIGDMKDLSGYQTTGLEIRQPEIGGTPGVYFGNSARDAAMFIPPRAGDAGYVPILMRVNRTDGGLVPSRLASQTGAPELVSETGILPDQISILTPEGWKPLADLPVVGEPGELEALMSQHDALIAQQATSRSVLAAADNLVLMRYPEYKTVMRAASVGKDPTGLGKIMGILGGVEVTKGRDIAYYLDRIGQTFPHGKLYNPEYANAAQRGETLKTVQGTMTYMRVPKPLIQSVVSDYAKLKNGEEFLAWDKKWRAIIADNSPILDPYMRDAWRTVYHSDGADDFYKGVVTKTSPDGFVRGEPVAYETRPSIDGVGNEMHPIAIEPSEWSRTSVVPNGELVRNSVSHYRRLNRSLPNWAHAGPYGGDLRGITYAHKTLDNVWRFAVLSPRLPFKTLFGRIFSEHTLYMAAAGRINALDGPSFTALLKWAEENGIDPLKLLDNPEVALGTMQQQLLGEATSQMSTGKAVLSAGDPNYGKAISHRYSQLHASGEISRRLIDDGAEATLAWLRGETTQVRNVPIDEVLAKAGAYERNADGTFTFHPEWMPIGSEGTGRAGAMTQEELTAKIAAEGFDQTKPVIMGRLAGEEDTVSEGLHRLESLRVSGAKTVPVKIVDLDAMRAEGIPLRAPEVEARPGVIEQVAGGGPGSYIYDRIYTPWAAQTARGDFDEVTQLQRMLDERLGLIGGDEQLRTAMKTGVYMHPDEYKQYYNEFLALMRENGEEITNAIKVKARAYAKQKAAIRVGTRDFADMINFKTDNALAVREPGAADTWNPPAEISGRYPALMNGDPNKMYDWLENHINGLFGFHKRMVAPEMKWMRVPLFRDNYIQELDRLKTLGITEERAIETATRYAADQTRAFIQDFQNETVVDKFFKQFMPFFSAWNNVTKRWIINLPAIRGQGIVMGQITTARFAQNTIQMAKGLGILREDATGRMYATVPGVEDLLEYFTGERVINISPSSLSIVGSLPGFSPTITTPLSLIAQHTPAGEFIHQFDSVIFPFGDQISMGPMAATYLWEAATHTPPPWEFTTRSFQQYRLNIAMSDSINLSRQRIGEPPSPDLFAQGDQDPEYRKAYTLWAEHILNNAQNISTAVLLLHGLSGILSPAAFSPTPAWNDDTAQLWRALSVFPDGSSIKSDVIDQFIATHPDSNWYISGKSITNGGEVPTANDFTDWIRQGQDGLRTIFTAEEKVAWSAGMEELSYLDARQNEVVAGLGNNVEGVLNNYYKYRQIVQESSREFDRYMLWNKPFAELWLRHQDDIPEDAGKEWFATNALLDARDAMSNVVDVFTDGGIISRDWKSVNAEVNAELDKLEAYSKNTPGQELAAGLQHYWDDIASPYYDKLSVLYDELGALPKALQAPIYEQIRKLNNSQVPTEYNGMTLPTPEQTSYNGLAPEAQRTKLAHWAILPTGYLDNFQLDKVYGEVPGLHELADYISKGTSNLQEWADTNQVSPNSSVYKAAQQEILSQEIAEAERLGVDPAYATLNLQPAFIRLMWAKFGENNTALQGINNYAMSAWNSLSAAGISPRGTSEQAVAAQRTLVKMVSDARDSKNPAYNAVFARLMDRLEVASAPSGKEELIGADMVMRIWFDSFYSASYTVATGG